MFCAFGGDLIMSVEPRCGLWLLRVARAAVRTRLIVSLLHPVTWSDWRVLVHSIRCPSLGLELEDRAWAGDYECNPGCMHKM